MGVYRRSLAYFRPFLGTTLAATLLTLASIAFSLLKPWPFKYLVDGVLPSETNEVTLRARAQIDAWFGGDPMHAVLCLSALVVGIQLAWSLLNFLSNRLFLIVGLKALLKLRTDLYACLQSLPLKYHDSRRSTDSSFRVAYDSQAIQTIYNKGYAGVLTAVVTLITTFAVMWAIDWKLTLISLAVLPFVVICIRFFAVRVREQSTTIQERESDVLSVVQEGMSAVRLVHAFGREDYEVRQFHSRASRSLAANLQLNTTSLISSIVVGALMALGTALLYYVGARHVFNGTLSVGDLIVFASYIAMLYQPLEQLTYTAWALEGAAAAAQRCFEVLDREEEARDEPGAKPLPPAQGRITFRNVEFGYAEDRTILRGIDLDIAPGEIVAFVGGTGAGKTSLLSLVPRFYDPTSGQVEIDGHDIRHCTRQSVRAQISIVLQDTLLFSTTVRENIAYGKPGATEEEIIHAAKRAQAHDFIMALPNGYDSLVGERGGHLSVGQRQRIGIARAFLKDAPILLLDEPTSALDPRTERAIMATIDELMKGRTTLIVTHRLAAVHNRARIVVLEHGRIAQIGTGPELLAQGGTYAALYQSEAA